MRRPALPARLALPALLLLVTAAGCADDPPAKRLPGDEPGTRAATAPALDGWERLADGPLSGRVNAVVVGVGAEAFVFGGDKFLCPPTADCAGPADPPFADGAAVDLGTGKWRPIADAPFGFTGASTAVLDGEVYVLPGRRLLRYSPADDTWTDLGPLPPRVGSVLVPTEHGLLALAGTEENAGPRDAVYDPVKGAWTVLPDDPSPRSFDRFAVADGDRVLVFGSPIGEPDEEVRTKAVAAYDWTDGTWSELPSAPAGGYQAWPLGDRAFLNPHFSRDGGGILDLATDTWSPIPDEGSGWEGDAAGVIDEGGATYEYAAGWVFDARNDGWLEFPERGGEVYDESLTALGQALVVFGGQTWEGSDGRLLAETWVWRPPT